MFDAISHWPPVGLQCYALSATPQRQCQPPPHNMHANDCRLHQACHSHQVFVPSVARATCKVWGPVFKTDPSPYPLHPQPYFLTRCLLPVWHVQHVLMLAVCCLVVIIIHQHSAAEVKTLQQETWTAQKLQVKGVLKTIAGTASMLQVQSSKPTAFVSHVQELLAHHMCSWDFVRH